MILAWASPFNTALFSETGHPPEMLEIFLFQSAQL